MARHELPTPPVILLVEDEQDDRAMYANYLQLIGFTAVEIGDTAEALRLAPTADIVVTGVRVPGPFDGVELVRRLRADGRTERKPVIVLTACAFEPEKARASAAGCDAFLPKPCLPETLATEVRRLLRLPAFGKVQGARPAKARLRQEERSGKRSPKA